ncbi:MAG: outer membrane beta-barrel protein [Gemmatimonadota bacterium]|nr:outer membrane beta-barrel protein [Gemmatimonadota bacterium]
MEKLAVLVLMGVFGAVLQPPIGEVGFSAGRYWPDITKRQPQTGLAVGLTARTPADGRLGLEFGLGYKQGGIPLTCGLRPRESGTLAAQRQASVRLDSPCPDDTETHQAEDRQHNHDFIDFAALGQVRYGVGDHLTLRLTAGPTWGIPVRCSSESLTFGDRQDCSASRVDTDWRFVTGAGVSLAVSPRLNASVDYRFGINLRELGLVTTSTGPIHGIARSLTAGMSYRFGGRQVVR